MWVRDIGLALPGLPRKISLLSKGVVVSAETRMVIGSGSSLHLAPGTRIGGRLFVVGKDSSVTIGERAVIRGDVRIGDNCSVVIGDNFRQFEAQLSLEKAEIRLGDDCLLEAVPPLQSQVRVVAGSMTVGDNTSIRGSIDVAGGTFSFGSNGFLNPGSEIRCEERVEIGDYVLISYSVDVFDTNTHSTDWRDRRREVDDGHPNGTNPRHQRPNTAPIRLGDDVWIGKDAAILKGVEVGSRSIVGTRAVVTRSCPDDSLMTGNPAVVRPLPASAPPNQV
jgi:acetyltransferase-like isoleucine patch superfamily enzyme